MSETLVVFNQAVTCGRSEGAIGGRRVMVRQKEWRTAGNRGSEADVLERKIPKFDLEHGSNVRVSDRGRSKSEIMYDPNRDGARKFDGGAPVGIVVGDLSSDVENGLRPLHKFGPSFTALVVVADSVGRVRRRKVRSRRCLVVRVRSAVGPVGKSPCSVGWWRRVPEGSFGLICRAVDARVAVDKQVVAVGVEHEGLSVVKERVLRSTS